MRLLLAVALIGVLAILFWTQSRYPQLNEKAMMSGAIQPEDPISFDPVYPVNTEMPSIQACEPAAELVTARWCQAPSAKLTGLGSVLALKTLATLVPSKKSKFPLRKAKW